ncbi:Hypothetical predicted protein [Cloeon dipterum]|uniref:Bee-milk protein n=1 Tax=Cloeon dipterum TaxID=197152 RepID=A0A8S1DPP6_9INSE|nr:Hypothetical predicted protein [Cloeon dipterum]
MGVEGARVEAGKAIRYFSLRAFALVHAGGCSSKSTNTMFFAAIFLVGLCLANAVNFTTVYEWDKFDFVWPSGADTSIGQIKDEYRPENVYILFMAVFGERLFLSLDLYPGIAATLVWLPTSGSSTAPPKLAPFPSWHLHKKDKCDSIQAAKGVEVDPEGWLWVLDEGSRNCSSKIWIFNLFNDTVERVHRFPDSVVSHSYEKRALRDIVLDKTPDDDLAYIADYKAVHIVIYSRNLDKSWEARQLYLREFESKELHSVSVSELKNEGGSAAVKLIGEWTASPYRMVIDSANVLYAAFTEKSYASKWNISEPFREHRFYEVGSLGAHVPFTFALDPNGILWMTQRNRTGGGIRHKLLKTAVGARSSLFSTSTGVTPTSDTKPALESNETSGGCAALVQSQSLNNILIWLLVCCVSCLVLSVIVIAWLTMKMRRMQTSSRQISTDNGAQMSVFPDDPVYDDVAPENSEPGMPENPDEPLYAEVDPEPPTSIPSPEPYEVPLHLMRNAKAGKRSEPVYDQVGQTEQDNIYDDVGPSGPASGPSRNEKSGRKPTESVQYLAVLP